jgi:hypothetical protein
MLAESVVRKECASLLERVRASDSHTCSNISIIFKVQLLEPPKEEKNKGKTWVGGLTTTSHPRSPTKQGLSPKVRKKKIQNITKCHTEASLSPSDFCVLVL